MLNRPVVLEEFTVASERQSAAVIKSIVSSIQISSAGGTKILNKFKYNDIPLSSRPAFLTFIFDEDALETLLSSKFSSLAFSDVMINLTGKLTQLRSITVRLNSNLSQKFQFTRAATS